MSYADQRWTTEVRTFDLGQGHKTRKRAVYPVNLEVIIRAYADPGKEIRERSMRGLVRMENLRSHTSDSSWSCSWRGKDNDPLTMYMESRGCLLGPETPTALRQYSTQWNPEQNTKKQGRIPWFLPACRKVEVTRVEVEFRRPFDILHPRSEPSFIRYRTLQARRAWGLRNERHQGVGTKLPGHPGTLTSPMRKIVSLASDTQNQNPKQPYQRPRPRLLVCERGQERRGVGTYWRQNKCHCHSGQPCIYLRICHNDKWQNKSYIYAKLYATFITTMNLFFRLII